MPVYWFALSFVPAIHWGRAALIFVLLHFLLYPSSNGYNSYMDRDEESIGGIKSPMQPTRQLFLVTIAMDLIAIILSFLISTTFAFVFLFYILCSRLYSFRGVRLKQYPILGYLTVIINQGALTFFMVYHGAEIYRTVHMPLTLLLSAAFLIGGFYPITQVYQHDQDRKDGVTTISMLLGKRGTFIFCSIMYAIAFLLLFLYYSNHQQLTRFFILQMFFIPVLVFFIRWAIRVWKDERYADFQNTMKMNWIASTCTSAGFITLLILNQLG
ncbi:prenyltransferase [Segetibacter sp. 3557_3]|nr:prenyltransferase [Segetibacter sp. 3557_3]